jgi:hypothetical protein
MGHLFTFLSPVAAVLPVGDEEVPNAIRRNIIDNKEKKT